MLNYFFTIKSHIIDLFIMGRVIQYRFEIDVPLVVGGGCLLGLAMEVASMEVLMVAYWYMWWPHWRGGGLFLAAVTLLVVALRCYWWC